MLAFNRYNWFLYYRVYALIWTTTPWTLPSNQAVCFNSCMSYSIVQEQLNGCVYIVATDLVHTLSKSLNRNFNILENIPGMYSNF